jgi:hypothetical protein
LYDCYDEQKTADSLTVAMMEGRIEIVKCLYECGGEKLLMLNDEVCGYSNFYYHFET